MLSSQSRKKRFYSGLLCHISLRGSPHMLKFPAWRKPSLAYAWTLDMHGMLLQSVEANLGGGLQVYFMPAIVFRRLGKLPDLREKPLSAVRFTYDLYNADKLLPIREMPE